MLHVLAEYGSVAVVAAALTGLGTLPARYLDRRLSPPRLLRAPLLLAAGWGLAAWLSALAALGDLDQRWLARGFLVVGLLLLVPWRRGDRAGQVRLLGDLVLLLVLVAPMALLVAGTPAMMYDEFAQWLPNTRYLVEHGHYWRWPEWVGLTSKPGYPNASAVIALLAAQLAGPDVEAPFKTFTVVLLGEFGAMLAALAAARWPPDAARFPIRAASLAGLLAGGCVLALVDPFIDPRIAFSAYTDTPSALILALAVMAAAYGIAAARHQAERAAAAWFAWAGLLSLTLVLLRTTNLVLVAALVGGSGLVLLALRAGSPRRWLRWAVLFGVPPIAGDLVWNAHLWAAHIGPDIAPRPFAQWHWTAPLTVLRALFADRLAAHPLLGPAALALLVAALAGGAMVWRRLGGRPDDALPPPRVVVALSGIVGACFLAFLAWAYIAVFSSEEVANAASLWRYVGQLGPMAAVAGGCAVLGLLPHRGRRGRGALAAAAAGAVLLGVLPVAGRGYYRLDCRFPDVVAARAAVARLHPALEPFAAPPPHPARVAVVHAAMGDWMAYALAFDMRWPASNQLVRYRATDEPLATTEAWAWDQGLDALLDFRPLDRARLRAQGIVPSVPLLGRPDARGSAWPVLATTDPTPLPPCRVWGR
ncbi:MAG TPA: hypothetical protein VG651_13425 [Stellaceae bacterium]|nr:hypothetical protein [Stellaceae bacterium]